MPMSSGGRVASSRACATRPKVGEIGLSGSAAPTRHSSLIGRYAMAMAEHREPCESKGSCTVLGAPGGEIPPGDSTIATDLVRGEIALSPLCSVSDGRPEITACRDGPGAAVSVRLHRCMILP